ncbi:hypothetical protein [Modestobacter marinus]|uniref:hypothetical protein n=1 Tax=Modestobacter marinus TaxID=477641 RepID=UPI00201AEA1D|nr:hypothetical protein [Modestobacter marinus]
MADARPGRRARRRRCPQCGELGALPVVYGLPDVATMELGAEGKVILRGCVLDPDDDPDWLCLSCAEGPDQLTA